MKWISVEDELPDEGLSVLVWDGSDVWCCYLEDGQWRMASGYPAVNITHWSDMPEGPK